MDFAELTQNTCKIDEPMSESMCRPQIQKGAPKRDRNTGLTNQNIKNW